MTQETQSTTKISSEVMTAAWAIVLGAIAPMLDSTMINIAIKQLNQTFQTSLNVVQWGITGYILALAIAVPIAGWLMNRFNGKYIFVGASLVFGLMSLLAGLSWDISVFIIFRFIQGFSAGVITTLMFSLIVKIAGREHVGKVMAVVSTPMIFGPILGPVLGGVIIHFAGWRWLFFVNIIILIIAIPLMMKYIPSFEPFNKDSKLDIAGITILTIMMICILLSVSLNSQQGDFFSPSTIVLLVIGIALIIVYIIYNRIKNYQTVLPTILFTKRTYGASSLGLLLSNIGIMGPMLILPLYFQVFKHYSTIDTALALIPQGIGMLITRPYIGKMIDRIGAKYVVLVSILIALVGTLPLLFISDKTSMWWLGIILFIRGCSIGGINLGLTADAYLSVDDHQLAEAGVGINMIENIGSSFGTAIIATAVALFNSQSGNNVANQITGFHAGFLISAIALVLIALPALLLTHKKASEA